jgi:two-component system, NtrC family, response regulator AtoC
MLSAALETPHHPDPSTGRHSASSPRVLVADDDRDMCELAVSGLTPLGFDICSCETPEEALAKVDDENFSVMLVDINMEGKSGLELCREVAVKRPELPVIVMTGFGTMEHAVGAIRAGAYDFVTKPVSMDALALILERAIRHRALTDELQRLRRRVHDNTLPQVVGSGEAIRLMSELVTRVAPTDTSVLITGESGTGKELVARALHEQSGRTGAFLAINCAAVPENLLESELFGHARGAFTDARVARAGLFVEANRGTLFLDEIGELPLPMQAKLLRALQERKVRPLGSTQEVPFNARLVTATNRDLELEVAEKRFREDLFYRVNVVRIDVPPLRKRGNDILELSQFFLARAAQRSGKPVPGIGRAVAECLMSHDWPGNVRELENAMERAAALAHFETLTIDDLPQKLRNSPVASGDAHHENPRDLPTFAVVEERYIREVLSAVHNNKTTAAKVLGFDRRTLYRKLKDMS